MGQKLPKQWKHWCQKAKLKPHSSRVSRERGEWGWWYLKGRGRVWRINDQGLFQCGDTYAEFDRWALCDILEAPMPKSLNEFMVTVRTLLSEKG